MVGRRRLHNRTLWIYLAAVLARQVITVQTFVEQMVSAPFPSPTQWAVCLTTASTVVVAEHA